MNIIIQSIKEASFLRMLLIGKELTDYDAIIDPKTKKMIAYIPFSQTIIFNMTTEMYEEELPDDDRKYIITNLGFDNHHFPHLVLNDQYKYYLATGDFSTIAFPKKIILLS